MRLRVALLSLIGIGIWSCAPEEIVEASTPDYAIDIQEAWITLPDGVRLAADLFVPQGGSKGERFPVLLEYLPYRKAESRGRNHALYSYFVRRGYIVARVDMRGTGNSEGRLIPYEYSDQ
jgi:predicted acyl esterase